MFVGVAQVKVPSPSLLKYCAVVPLPLTFSSAAPTELSVIVAAFTELKVANVPNPKLVLAVAAFDKSDRLLVLVNLVPIEVVIVVLKLASSPNAAASSLSVLSASGAVSTKLDTAVST